MEEKIKYPGKEIIGLVFGIFSLIHGVVCFVGCIPFSGWWTGVVLAASGIAYAAVAKTMYKTIMANATVHTEKILIGKNLATAGLILSIIGLAFTLISILLSATALLVIGSWLLEQYVF